MTRNLLLSFLPRRPYFLGRLAHLCASFWGFRITSIHRRLGGRNPATISGIISGVIVYAVNVISVMRLMTNISKEVFKRILPRLAHLDTPSSVAMVLRVIWVATTLLYVVPRRVFLTLNFIAGVSVNRVWSVMTLDKLKRLPRDVSTIRTSSFCNRRFFTAPTRAFHVSSVAYTLLITLLIAPVALSQGSRYDNFTWTANPLTPGQSASVLTVPRAAIHVCSHPANATPCTNYASIYTDSSLSTPITQPGFASDDYGNFGFYASAGSYDYTVTVNGISAGPYPITMGQFAGFNGYDFASGIPTDGTTDASSALTSAINSAISSNTPRLILPCGQIKVNNAINVTNKQGLTIEGCAPLFGGNGELVSNTNVTEILCNTGAVCMDFTGSSWVKLKDVELRTTNGYTNPSTVGLLFGRDNAAGGGTGAYCFSQFNTLEGVVVYFEPNAAATSKGRLGFYNVGAEHFNIKGPGLYRGDVGGYWSDSNVLGIASPYQTLQTGCPVSMTIVSVDSGVSFQAAGTGPSNPALEVYGTQLFDFDFNNIHAINSNGGATYAMNLNTSGTGANRFKISGQFEDFPSGFNTNGPINNSKIDVVVVSPTSQLFTIGANVDMTNTEFRIQQTGGVAQATFNSGSNDTCKGCTIYSGTAMGTAGINSSGLTVTQSQIFMPGSSSNPTLNASSAYELFNNNGITFVGGTKIGASGSTLTDSRKLVQDVIDCGVTTTCANVSNNSDRIVRGTATLSSGSPSTAVITGISPVFTSTSSYNCVVTNKTTQANPVKCTNTSTSSITITGPNTVTDTVDYVLIGH